MRVSGKTLIRVTLAIAVFILVGATAGAQSLTVLRSESDISRIEEVFLDRFMAGDFDDAFDLYRSSASALSGPEIDTLLESTARQLSSLANTYGAPIDAIMVDRELIGGALLQRSYLLRYQALPLRAQFIYYSAGDRWRLTYFSWDDQYTELFGR